MSSAAPVTYQVTTRTVTGVDLELFSGGSGSPIFILHDYECPNDWYPYLDTLARGFSIEAPSHPGFGKSTLPPDFDSIDDLVYLYLDMLSQRKAERAHLVGMGLGGWIAAEMAIRCTHRLNTLVLVDAVGIKISDRTVRDIADTFVVGPEELVRLTWHDTERGAREMKLPGLGNRTEEELVLLLRNRQSAARLAWKPFMHNPKLRAQLHRIDIPTLVLWGESDQLVTPTYGRAYADAIPGAQFKLIERAGHFPYLEQPDAFTREISDFLKADQG